MSWQVGLLGFAASLLISVVTAPVGISGAVFLLPVQLDVLHVPSPQVTPTNLLSNVIADPARCSVITGANGWPVHWRGT